MSNNHSTPSSAESALDKLIKQTIILKSKLASLESYSAPSRIVEDIEKTSLELAKAISSPIPPNVEELVSHIKFEVPSVVTSEAKPTEKPQETQIKKELSEWEKVLEKASSQVEACASQKGNVQAKVLAYSELIVPLNNSRVSPDAEQTKSVIRNFANVPRSAEYEVRMDQMTDCWRIAESLCNGTKGNDFAIRFLESMYLRHVEKILAQFPRDALLGGRPTIVERIKAFVGIKLKRMSPAELSNVEMVGGTSCWAVIFYLMRTGHVQEALQYCRQAESLSGKSGFELATYLEAYLQDVITPSIRAQIHSDYNQRNLLGNQDVFLLAILKILGKCDMGKKVLSLAVIQTTEDWLWLQFKLLSADHYPFTDLQQQVAKLSIDNALMHFQMLLLIRQYTKAVERLWNTDFGKVDALHFAICFFICNLVKNVSGDAIFGDHGLNMSLLVAVYNRAFVKKYLEPNFLVHYSFFLSSLLVGEEAVAHAVIESENYGFWLGDVQSDGSTTPGALVSYSRLIGDLTLRVSAKAADLCISQQRLAEALQLLNLAGNYERVLKLVNETLVKILLDSSPRNNDLSISQAVVDFYGGNNNILIQVSRAEYQKSLLLLRLVEFRSLCVHEKDYERALATMEMLDLLPLKGDIVEASRRAESVKLTSDSDLLVYLPEVCLLTMQCASEVYKRAAMRAGIDPGRQQIMRSLSEKVKYLMTFVSLLQHRVPSEYVAKMTRMEMSML